MKVDTGAETSTIPTKQWESIKRKPRLRKARATLKAFGNTCIESEGTAIVPITVGDKKVMTEVFVTKGQTTAVLGLQVCTKLGLVQKEKNGRCIQTNSISLENEKRKVNRTELLTTQDLQEKFKDVFEGVGSYNTQYHIQLKEEAVPVMQPPRRVPPAIMPELKKKLKEMEDNGIIEPVNEPTEWVHNLVTAQKPDGSLRLCLDPKVLNKNIKREIFEIPTFGQIIPQLGGKKVFTTLDQKDAYWQVELDKASSRLCTFNTPFGRFCFKRMPFGISSASEILQKRAYETFGDIQGLHILHDDAPIAAETDAECDEILLKVLQRAKDHNIKFNLKKMQLRQKVVTYMGRKIGADGVKPDPKKVQAIVDTPAPVDKTGIQRILGMLNFLSPFIPNMSTLTAPLRNRGTVPVEP
ncbi:Pol polyprotein [Elysia marginata]|uniref:Pol polyprotein n=1 Tax=Elysia marginata TaxID=1093978 RepID=A0AAV4JHR4_9GAST|nr:Pol polyprotein [Elysia marginata]